jgi:uncharacterized membrane protein YphA (DoxX/SURF4 family)
MISVSKSRLQSAWWALRLSFGLVPFLAGLDKFFDILTDWTQYQSPILQQALPISTTTFMHVVGVIEMIVGIAILTRWTRVGSYVAMVWLAAISANLLTTGKYFDVAVGDFVMAVGAYTLASLTEALVEPAASAQWIHGRAEQVHGLGWAHNGVETRSDV